MSSDRKQSFGGTCFRIDEVESIRFSRNIGTYLTTYIPKVTTARTWNLTQKKVCERCSCVFERGREPTSEIWWQWSLCKILFSIIHTLEARKEGALAQDQWTLYISSSPFAGSFSVCLQTGLLKGKRGHKFFQELLIFFLFHLYVNFTAPKYSLFRRYDTDMRYLTYRYQSYTMGSINDRDQHVKNHFKLMLDLYSTDEWCDIHVQNPGGI